MVAVISLVFGVSLASAMLSISFDVGERMSGELRGYGSNILIVPKDTTLRVGSGELSFGSLSGEGFIKEADISQIELLPSSKYLVGYSPSIYATVDASSQKIVLLGTWFDQSMKVNPFWRLKGEVIANRNDEGSAIVGTNVAERLSIRLGDSLRVERQGQAYDLHVVGIVSTGGSEDNQILVSLAQAQIISQKAGLVHTIEASYSANRVDLKSIAEEIAGAMPGAEVKIISQVAEAEQSFLAKIQTTITILTSTVLTASVLAIMSTMSTTVLERRREIGLMLALGASSKKIISLFFAEALMIGFAGGLIGYVLGLGLASAIWLNVFNATITPKVTTIPVTLAVAIVAALTASILPVKQALSLNLSMTLRS